jgi:TldD protein
MQALPSTLLPLLGRGDFSDLYLEESDHLVLVREDGRLDDISQGRSAGAGLRYVKGDETRFASLDARAPLTLGFSPEEAARLKVLARDLGRGWPVKKALSSPREASGRSVPVPAGEGPSLSEKGSLLASAETAARLDPAIVQVTLTLAERRKRLGVLTSEGAFRWEVRLYTAFIVQVTASRDGLLQTGTEVIGGLGGFEIFKKNSPDEAARLAARRAVAKLSAPPAPLGEMPVVLSAQAGGTMIHEAIGHALEADAIQEGTSPHFAGKIGKIVANEKVTVLDDPTLDGWRGSFGFDDEGTPAERTVLVENGVLKTYMYDRLTARREGRSSNGHGRRESYRFKPIPRMSNTFVARGPDDPDSILRSLKKGLLVTRMGGGQVNTTTGEFVFEVEEGFMVEDGAVKHMVRGANLLGTAPQVLGSIDKVGTDMGWGLGTCGKAGQGVPVTDGLPTLRIPRILVGGQ